MNKMVAALVDAYKAFTLRFGASRWASTWSYGPAPYDYGGTASRAPENAIVAATVRWVCRTAPEAPLIVQRRAADGTLEVLPTHPLLDLLARPNPYYSGLQLWNGALADLLLSGNAYWVKVRSGGGRVVELWWVPQAQLEPRWPDDGRPPFISHYEYAVQGEVVRLEVADVVHLRDGFDPRNPRKGLSPLQALLREIATDDEASGFTASILHNLGVPGVVLSPEPGVAASDADLEEIKTRFAERFGGRNRGQPLVLRGPTKVAVLSFSPEQMQLRELRRIPEERISAMYGVPAVVVGLGAGLDRSTYSNMAEAREAAYESNIIPLQRLLGAELQHQLLPDFGDARTLVLGWDYSAVRVLQPDQSALMERAVAGFAGGVLTRAEARQLVGEEAEPADEVFARQAAITLIPRDLPPEAPALEAPPPPTPLRALPEARALGPVATKGADDVVPALTRSRDRLGPRLEADVAAYLSAQQAAALTALQRPAKAMADVPVDAAAATSELAALLAPYYEQVLAEAAVAVRLGLAVAFDVPDPLTTRYLAAAGAQIGGITETTRAAVAAALQEGAALGEGIPQLAARLRALGAFDRSRAVTIARTELANASLEAAVTTYEASGVVAGVRVLDGDYDAACAARNGRTFPLAAAAGEPRLLHPNCTAAWSPIVAEAGAVGAA